MWRIYSNPDPHESKKEDIMIIKKTTTQRCISIENFGTVILLALSGTFW
jgi:hypothetical protein